MGLPYFYLDVCWVFRMSTLTYVGSSVLISCRMLCLPYLYLDVCHDVCWVFRIYLVTYVGFSVLFSWRMLGLSYLSHDVCCVFRISTLTYARSSLCLTWGMLGLPYFYRDVMLGLPYFYRDIWRVFRISFMTYGCPFVCIFLFHKHKILNRKLIHSIKHCILVLLTPWYLIFY